MGERLIVQFARGSRRNENFTPNGPAVFQETGSPGERLILKDGTSLYGPARTFYFGTRLRF